MSPQNTCQSCGADIRWSQNGMTGNVMPLNPDPVAEGNVFVFENGTHKGKCIVLSGPLLAAAQKDDDVAMRTTHHATCPDAARHRR